MAGMTLDEIAEALGLSRQTVQYYEQRAIKKLRRNAELKRSWREGGFESPDSWEPAPLGNEEKAGWHARKA
jgi:predicted transcriptional regulator